MVRKHTQNCPVLLVPTTVGLRVILYEVLGKYKILRGIKIIISNSAHKITSFWVFVINIIKRIAIITKIVRYIYPENAGISPFHLPTSFTPEGVSKVLMKVALVLQSQVFRISFFYLGFLSQITFTNHRTAGEGGGHFFNSSLPLPPTSQTLRH